MIGWRLRSSVLLLWSLLLLAGCAGAPPGTVPYSEASYDRTFDTALGALADQKMVVGESSRLKGQIVATLDGDTITATIQPQFDGTNRVTFQPQPASPSASQLLKKVVDSYNLRMSKNSLLPGGLL